MIEGKKTVELMYTLENNDADMPNIVLELWVFAYLIKNLIKPQLWINPHISRISLSTVISFIL